MNVKWLSLLTLCLLSQSIFAANLGNYGEIFKVIEMDIREVIMRRLHALEASGELAHYQEDVQKRVSAHIIRPKALALSTTNHPLSFQVDPSMIVNHDILGPNGLVIARRGAHLNPFDVISYAKTLFFFDGDDKHQVAWVIRHYQDYGHVKFILTGGDIRDGANRFGRIYFDIGGQLISYFHIKHVPSIVNQEGRVWRIQEIGVHDA